MCVNFIASLAHSPCAKDLKPELYNIYLSLLSFSEEGIPVDINLKCYSNERYFKYY